MEDILSLIKRLNQAQGSQVLPSGQRFGIMDFINNPPPLTPGLRTDSNAPVDPISAQDSPNQGMAVSLPARSGADLPKIAAPPINNRSISSTNEDTDSEEESTEKPTPKAPSSDDYDNSQALKDAQDKSANNSLNANLLNAGQTINEALTRHEYNRDVNKSLEKNADQPVRDIQTQQKSKKDDLDILQEMFKTSSQKKLTDPDSDVSKATRGLLKELGMDIGDGSSAYDIQQATAIDRLLGQKTSADARKEIASENAQNRADLNSDKNKQEQDKRDQYIWSRALGQARNDKDISTAATAANRLQNTLNNLSQKSVVSPQDLRELQQLTVAVQGLNGRSGVHEREERYANSLGLKATDLEQFLSGQMTDVGKQNDILNKMKELAHLEVGNFGENLSRRFAYKTAGLKDVLKRHPEYQSDLDELKNAAGGQVVDAAPGAANPGQRTRQSTSTSRPTIKVKASDGTVRDIYQDQFLAAQQEAKKNGQTLQVLQ